MKNCSISIRENSINFFKGKYEINSDDRFLKMFLHYLDAYCAEMKQTEWDVLLDDKNYQSVYGLFDNIMVKRHELDKVVY
jgi:hypothetical protein